MTLYHFSNARFSMFDASFLGAATIERGSDNEDTMAISTFGFCFVDTSDKDALEAVYGEDFGAYVATCEFDGSENYDSTWSDFCDWISRDGIAAVRECLENDGVEFLRLDNGSFNEIIPLNAADVTIINWN